jgi:hypothetical protein
VSSLGDLFDAVSVALAGESETSTTSVVWGTRAKARQVNQGTRVANRVVFEPLDTPKIGDLEPGRMPGGNEKRIHKMWAAATIYVWGYDGSTQEHAASERWQYEAVRALLGNVLRVLHEARAGEIQYGPVKKVGPQKVESVLGQEWMFTISVIDDFTGIPDEAVIRPDPTFTTTFTLPSEA